MIVVPFFAAIAFLAPPAVFGGLQAHQIVHAVRPSHTQPVVALRPVRFWVWPTPGSAPPVSRAASLVA